MTRAIQFSEVPKFCFWPKQATVFFQALVLVFFAGCGNRVEHEKYYLDQAKSLMQANRYDLAKLELKNVLAINQANYEAYYQLGIIHESQQLYQEAAANYTQVLEIQPNYVEAKTRLGRVQLLAGKDTAAVDKAKAALAADPGSVEAKALMASVKAKQGNLDSAIKDLELALKARPDFTDTAVELAQLHFRRGETARAENVLTQSIARQSKNISLRVALANLYLQTKQQGKAAGQLREMAGLEPENNLHHLRLATLYVLAGEKDNAEKTLRASVAQQPSDLGRAQLLAEFLLRYRSPEKAEMLWQGLIQTNPSELDLRFGLADFYGLTGQIDKAEQAYRDIIAQNGNPVANERARTQLAQALTAAGKASSAKTLVDEVLKLNPKNVEASVLHGRLALEAGDAQLAIADFRWALKDYPDSIEYTGMLARAHVANNEPMLAREILASAVKRNPANPQGRLMLAEFLAQTRDFNAALAEVGAALKLSPLDARLLQMRATLQAANQGLPGAEAGLTSMTNYLSPAAQNYFRLGSYYLGERKFGAAVGEFQRALRTSPKAIEPLKGIVQAYLAQGRADLALAKIKGQLRIDSPTLNQAYYLLGEFYREQKKYAEAKQAYGRSLNINPFWQTPYLALAQLHHDSKDNSKAQEVLEAGLRQMPGDPILAFAHGAILETNQAHDRALAQYDAIFKQNPAMDVAANNLAMMLLEKRSDASSRERALTIARRFENTSNPAYLDTLGWAWVKNGQPRRGLPYLQRALESQSEVSSIGQFHLGMAYHEAGDKQRAKIHLQNALTGGNTFAGIETAKSLIAKL